MKQKRHPRRQSGYGMARFFTAANMATGNAACGWQGSTRMGRFGTGSEIFRTVAMLLAAGIIAIMIGQPVMAQETTPLNDYSGTVLSGLITAQIQMPVEKCRKICSDRMGCAGFDHSYSTNQCRIFGGIASAREASSFTAATRYPIPGYRQPVAETREIEENVLDAEPPRNFKYYLNNDLFGHDLDQSVATSMAQCEGFCRANLECKAFTFNEWNQKCFLKSGINELRLEPRARTGVLTSEPQPSYRDAQIVMEYYRGYIITGSQLGGRRSASSRDQCESQCWNSDQCVAFSFVRAQRQCRLYDQASNRFPQNGVESGAKIQPRP